MTHDRMAEGLQAGERHVGGQDGCRRHEPGRRPRPHGAQPTPQQSRHDREVRAGNGNEMAEPQVGKVVLDGKTRQGSLITADHARREGPGRIGAGV